MEASEKLPEPSWTMTRNQFSIKCIASLGVTYVSEMCLDSLETFLHHIHRADNYIAPILSDVPKHNYGIGNTQHMGERYYDGF